MILYDAILFMPLHWGHCYHVLAFCSTQAKLSVISAYVANNPVDVCAVCVQAHRSVMSFWTSRLLASKQSRALPQLTMLPSSMWR